MVKAVIFDLDDTLCNTGEILGDALERVFGTNMAHFPGKTTQELLEWEGEVFTQLMQEEVPVPTAVILVWLRFFEDFGFKPQLRAIYQMRISLEKEISNRINFTPGASEILEYLEGEEIRVGILTNGPFWEQVGKLLALNIDRKIDYMVTPDLCMTSKPDRNNFRYILQKMELETDEVIMVGDEFNADIKGAQNAGIKGILYKAKTREYTSEQEKQADGVIDNLEQLKQYLS